MTRRDLETVLGWPLAAVSLASGAVVAAWPLLGGLALFTVTVLFVLYLYPRAGLALVVMTAFLDTTDFVHENPMRSGPEFYALVLVPTLVMTLLVGLRSVANPPSLNRIPLTGRTALLLLFVLWACTALLWTLDPLHGISCCVNLWGGFLIYVLCSALITEKRHLENIFLLLVGWATLLGVSTFLSIRLEFQDYYEWSLAGRFNLRMGIGVDGMRAGGFSLPQLAGTYLVFPFFVCCVGLFPRAGRRGKVMLGLLGVFLIHNIIATGSKASLGALIAASFFFLLAYPGIRRWFYLTLPGFGALLLAILIVNMAFFGSDRLVRGAEVHSMSFALRFGFWKRGFELLAERWFGAGTGGFSHLVNPWPGAHNVYLSVLFDLGVVGLALMGLCVVCTAARVVETMAAGSADRDLRRYVYCLAAALGAVAVHGMADISYSLALVWLIMGLLNAALEISTRGGGGGQETLVRPAWERKCR